MRHYSRPLLVAWIIALSLSLSGTFGTPTTSAIGGNTWSYYLLTDDNKIGLGIESQPNLPTTPVAVNGLTFGDSLVAIDVRPQNGKLYGLATTSVTGEVRLYMIDLGSGTPIATPIGNAIVVSPNSIGSDVGIDFNPTVDRLRVVTATSLNLRINPNTGALAASDSAINGGTTSVDATAYTNNAPNATVTTQYTLDAASNSLYIQSPPNNGTQTSGLAVQLNGAPLDFSASSGFDIPAGVNVTVSGNAATGEALAALTVGGIASLYSIELSTGAATLLEPLGGLTIRDIAIIPTASPAISLSSDGTQLMRYTTNNPGTTTNVNISNIALTETLVGIDGRPQTGQLYGLGVDALANTASLYLIDPQTGIASLVGVSGQIAFVESNGITPVDLPANIAGYGFDFNPTVDRIRVVTGTGLNFRINPISGAPIDGNLNISPAPDGINPDGPLNGLPAGSTGIAATAYTNSYGQVLSGGTTSQYAIDAASDQLFIQNPPNAGTQTNPLSLALGGAPLDFSDVNGFDIASGTSVATSGTPATGDGYAALIIGGVTGLYKIDLASGNTTSLGAIGTGATTIAGLVVWNAPTQFSISAGSAPITETSGNVIITITRRGGAPAVISYSITAGSAIAGSDYTAATGVLTFSSGEISKTFSLQILDDTIEEPDETLTIQLNGPITGTNSQTLTIVSDDSNIAFPWVHN
jgi:hypothetical protein